MSDSLFLILHRVRGAPAFDIAIRDDTTGTPSDPGPWWIIPTSGHRAYPFRWWDMEDLHDISDINQFGFHTCPTQAINALPSEWPDHYPDRPSPTAPRRLASLLGALGLGPAASLRRRKF